MAYNIKSVLVDFFEEELNGNKFVDSKKMILLK